MILSRRALLTGLIASAPLLSLAGCGTRTVYARRSLRRGLGYLDRQLSPNSWHVQGGSTTAAGPNFAADMVLYRAAIIVIAAGYTHMQIVDFQVTDLPQGAGVHQNVDMRVVGVNDPNPLFVCIARASFRPNCRTIEARAAIRRTAGRMGQSAAQTEAEIDATRRQLAAGEIR